MIRSEKFRRNKFGIVLICATILIIYCLETREPQPQSSSTPTPTKLLIQMEEGSQNSYDNLLERQRQFAKAKLLNAVKQMENSLNISGKLLDDRQRQSQLATAKIINAISHMEDSLIATDTTLLEPSALHRCQSSGLFLLVMVMSAPDNLEQRRVIRSTWAEMRNQWEAEFLRENQNESEVAQVLRPLFFLGQPEGKVSNDVQKEWEQHGDLVIDNFHDESNLTLTLKTLRMLRWATLNCASAQYVMKLDDDAFVHIPKLLKSLLNFSQSQKDQSLQQPRVILGNVIRDSIVYRDPFSEFFAPKILYSWEHYPTYLSDFCYVLGMAAAQEIVDYVERSRSALKLFHIEDVFITGIVANERLGIPLQEIGPVLANAKSVVGNKSLNIEPGKNETTTSLEWVLQHVIIHPVTSEQNRCWTKFTGQGSLTEDC